MKEEKAIALTNNESAGVFGEFLRVRFDNLMHEAGLIPGINYDLNIFVRENIVFTTFVSVNETAKELYETFKSAPEKPKRDEVENAMYLYSVRTTTKPAQFTEDFIMEFRDAKFEDVKDAVKKKTRDFTAFEKTPFIVQIINLDKASDSVKKILPFVRDFYVRAVVGELGRIYFRAVINETQPGQYLLRGDLKTTEPKISEPKDAVETAIRTLKENNFERKLFEFLQADAVKMDGKDQFTQKDISDALAFVAFGTVGPKQPAEKK